MIPLNMTIAEAFRYHREIVTDEDIQEALDRDQSLLEHLENIFETSDLDELNSISNELNNWRDNFYEFDTPEKALEELKSHRDFVEDIKRSYEDRHGLIFDTPLDQLHQWVAEDIDKVPDEDGIIIYDVDKVLLGEDLKTLAEIVNPDTCSNEQLQAYSRILAILHGIYNK